MALNRPPACTCLNFACLPPRHGEDPSLAKGVQGAFTEIWACWCSRLPAPQGARPSFVRHQQNSRDLVLSLGSSSVAPLPPFLTFQCPCVHFVCGVQAFSCSGWEERGQLLTHLPRIAASGRDPRAPWAAALTLGLLLAGSSRCMHGCFCWGPSLSLGLANPSQPQALHPNSASSSGRPWPLRRPRLPAGHASLVIA